MRKTLTYIFVILLGLIFIAYLIFRFAPLGMTKTDAEIDDYFKDVPQKPTFQTYEVRGHTIHYASIGPQHLPTIIFIHGSPGSWDAYMTYFKDTALVNHFRMISVDRVGYGKSNKGQPESSLFLQAAYIQPLLETIPDSVPTLLVGHSYGGPVAYRMGMDYADKIDGLLILAGLADPVLEGRLWIQKPFRHWSLRWLLPPDLDISNREIVPLKQELFDQENMWEKIRSHTLIIQGDEDILVDKGHADYAEKMLINAASVKVIRMPEENHFIPWTQSQLVTESIFKLYKLIQEDRVTTLD